jgi:hypothetical protein
MDCLLRDTRGNRKGFPPVVLRELLALREYRALLDAENSPAWVVIRKRGS